MAYELLLSIIDRRRKEVGIPSERKLTIQAEVGIKSIKHIRDGHAPRPDTLAKLAAALKIPASMLLDAAASEQVQMTVQPERRLTRVPIKGVVQAGVWREAIEWPPSDWIPITIMDNGKFPGTERFGLMVRGSSMDLLYPEGTMVIVVRYGDIGRGPAPGERVIVLRRAQDMDAYEATVKEFQIDAKGRRVLWPRSSDPDFQAPFILADGQATEEIPLSGLPSYADAGNLHDGGEPDISIVGLVIGSYRDEI